MKTNRILLPGVAAIFLLLFSTSLFAQIKFDVKTKWAQKMELTTAKRGVIAAIEADSSRSTAEFGEDYALWLKNLRRTKGKNDTVIVALDLELRKPSLMSEGELLKKGRLTVRYGRETLDSLRGLTGTAQTIADRREEYEALNHLIATAVAGLIPKGGILAAPILTALLEEVNAAPEPEEICEAVLIGTSVVEWLDSWVVQ